ncbi:exocyst complex component 5-like [Littorina saxatilis]|uniref:Exocyst complex component 5 n=1 Tax=Littorina saxatilis TaxID=31220 RepID=A0AAN9BEA1_9CAEN
MSVEELDQEPFSVHEFVERLTSKTMGARARGRPEDFDPMMLHGAFEKMISDLQEKNAKVQKDIDSWEAAAREEEKRHWGRVGELQKTNQNLYTDFQKLDERISYVATKVVHLGDQLEGVNTPRARAVEAQRLMNYLAEFLQEQPLTSAVLTDPFQLMVTADIIQKLHMIALELPVGGRFDRARQKIAEKYDHVEQELIEEFRLSHQQTDKRKMKRIASVLQNFKGYGKCIETFIVESQKGAFLKGSPFEEVVPLCERTWTLITEVFVNPDSVMGKFVQHIFQNRIQGHVASMLEDRSEPEQYLKNLFDLYTKTNKLAGELGKFKLGADSAFLTKLTRAIFSQHLDKYAEVELRYLHTRCGSILTHYYESKDHHKRQLQSGGIHDLKRDIQAKIGTVTKAGQGVENFGGETFLSQEVAINILQETKNAFRRCQVLSYSSDLSGNAVKIFEVLVTYLVTEHIDYAVEIGLLGIPLAEPKAQPEIYFFDIVNEANTLFHLFEKQFLDSLIPLVLSSQRHGVCLKRKRETREQLEQKIGMGLDRSITAIVGWIRFIFTTEQKKTDFKPEEDAPMQMISPACSKVVRALTAFVESIRSSLDGQNVEICMTELGKRFHRMVYEHILNFQYNSIGAMLVICDVNEYRKCVKEGMRIPIITQLFERLHALCNLLVVVPENLKVVRSGEQLADLEDSVIQNFVQHRDDYRTARIANFIK